MGNYPARFYQGARFVDTTNFHTKHQDIKGPGTLNYGFVVSTQLTSFFNAPGSLVYFNVPGPLIALIEQYFIYW
jgi:hypothetical protein